MPSVPVLCTGVSLSFLYYLWITIHSVLVFLKLAPYVFFICELLCHLWQDCVVVSHCPFFVICELLWILCQYCVDLSLLSVTYYTFCGSIVSTCFFAVFNYLWSSTLFVAVLCTCLVVLSLLSMNNYDFWVTTLSSRWTLFIICELLCILWKYYIEVSRFLFFIICELLRLGRITQLFFVAFFKVVN